MLRRLWWFTLGLGAGLGGSAWVAVRLTRARDSLTPANLGRAAALSVADALRAAGGRLKDPR